jgi:FKBP-type peptidyl-prolyl cis-trans isomerase (trigger factor)
MNEYYTREDKSDSLIIFKVTLPGEAFEQSYQQLLQKELERTNVKGFRKGKFPTEELEKQVKPALLMETFQRLAPYYVNAAIIKEKLEPVAQPEYKDVKNLETNEPVTFDVEITVMPSFKLGKLNKIKPDTKDEKATEEDVTKTLDNMFANNKEKIKETEINDKWAVEIAKMYQFPTLKTLEELKKEIKTVITDQKAAYIRQAQEAEVLRKAVVASKIEVPEVAIKHEAHEREHAFEHDIENMKTTVEEFCKSRETTLEEMREQWAKDAKEALENDVLFRTYAADKKIEVSDDELEAEIAKIKVSNSQAQQVDEKIYEDEGWRNNARNYVLKQKAFRAIVDEILGEYVPANAVEVIKGGKSEKAAEKKSEKETKKKETKNDAKKK